MSKPHRHVHTIKQEPESPHFIIIAANPGYKSRSYGIRSLWKLDDKTILDLQYESIKRCYPHSTITVVVGFQHHKIIKKNTKEVRFVYDQLHKEHGQIGNLGLALMGVLESKVVVMHGDIIFNDLTIKGINQGRSKILTDSFGMMPEKKIGLRGYPLVEQFGYSWKTKWAQIAYLKGSELKRFRYFCSREENKKKVTFEGIQYVIDRGGTIEVWEPDGYSVKEINTYKDLVV